MRTTPVVVAARLECIRRIPGLLLCQRDLRLGTLGVGGLMAPLVVDRLLAPRPTVVANVLRILYAFRAQNTHLR